MRSSSKFALAGLVIAFACSANVVKADDYALKLTRPSKVGDKLAHDAQLVSTTTRKTNMPGAPATPAIANKPVLTQEQQDAIKNSGVQIPAAGLSALGGGGLGGFVSSRSNAAAGGAGAPAKPEETTTVLKYTEEVLEVDANGLPTKTSITIAEFTKTSAGATKALLPPGTKLTKSEGADSTVTSVAGGAAGVFSKDMSAGIKTGGHVVDTSAKFTSDDKSVSISHEANLALITLSPSNHSHTADELFGVTGNKKVGDTWPINSQLYVDSLEGKEGMVSADQIKGNATFTKIDVVNGVKCAIVDAQMTVSNIKPPNLPANLKIKSADANITSTSPVPLDPTVPGMGHSTTSKITVDAEASYGGHAAGMTMEMVNKIDDKITPAK